MGSQGLHVFFPGISRDVHPKVFVLSPFRSLLFQSNYFFDFTVCGCAAIPTYILSFETGRVGPPTHRVSDNVVGPPYIRDREVEVRQNFVPPSPSSGRAGWGFNKFFDPRLKALVVSDD